jgi:hypothetical protein
MMITLYITVACKDTLFITTTAHGTMVVEDGDGFE